MSCSSAPIWFRFSQRTGALPTVDGCSKVTVSEHSVLHLVSCRQSNNIIMCVCGGGGGGGCMGLCLRVGGGVHASIMCVSGGGRGGGGECMGLCGRGSAWVYMCSVHV